MFNWYSVDYKRDLLGITVGCLKKRAKVLKDQQFLKFVLNWIKTNILETWTFKSLNSSIKRDFLSFQNSFENVSSKNFAWTQPRKPKELFLAPNKKLKNSFDANKINLFLADHFLKICGVTIWRGKIYSSLIIIEWAPCSDPAMSWPWQ